MNISYLHQPYLAGLNYRLRRSHYANSIAFYLLKLYRTNYIMKSVRLIKFFLKQQLAILKLILKASLTRKFEIIGSNLRHRSNIVIFYYIDYMIIYNYLKIFSR